MSIPVYHNQDATRYHLAKVAAVMIVVMMFIAHKHALMGVESPILGIVLLVSSTVPKIAALIIPHVRLDAKMIVEKPIVRLMINAKRRT